MGEKILFEMRVKNDENGTQIEINASPEWCDHHQPHHLKRHLFAWMNCGSGKHKRPHMRRQPPAAELRRTLDSLQNIYDDLYGSPAEAG